MIVTFALEIEEVKTLLFLLNQVRYGDIPPSGIKLYDELASFVKKYDAHTKIEE